MHMMEPFQCLLYLNLQRQMFGAVRHRLSTRLCTILNDLDPRLTAVCVPEARSAKDLFEKQRSSRRIITFCQDVDRILGGGVATSQVTEFCKCKNSFLY